MKMGANEYTAAGGLILLIIVLSIYSNRIRPAEPAVLEKPVTHELHEGVILTHGPVVTNARMKFPDSNVARTADACAGLTNPKTAAECMHIPVVTACDLPQRDRIWFRDHPRDAGPLHDLGVACPGDDPKMEPYPQ